MKLQLIFTVVVGVCLRNVYGIIELTEQQGLFTSPNYPDNYPANTSTEWIIRLPRSYHFVFIRILYFSTVENVDVLEVYNGNHSSNSNLLQTLSGNIYHGDGRLDIVSHGYEMYITFRSGHGTAHKGFVAEYYSLTRNYELTGQRGWFSTTNHPYFYRNNEYIRWVIKPDSNHSDGTTYLTIENFSTEECCDKVQISTDTEIIGTFSGNDGPPPLSFPSNTTITIYFNTDLTTRSRGFWGSYSRVDAPNSPGEPGENLPSPRILSNTFGDIISDNYPDPYGINLVEEWVIKVMNPNKDKIHLFIKDFETELHKDILAIHDGSNSSTPLLASLSGYHKDIRLNYVSTGPYLFLRFTTGLNTTRRGFFARYEAVPSCFNPEPEPGPSPEPEPDTSTKPEPDTSSESEPNTSAEPEPDPSSQRGPDPEPVTETQSASTIKQPYLNSFLLIVIISKIHLVSTFSRSS